MENLNTFTWISIFAVSAAIVNSIGILVVFRKKEWVERTKNLFMCFASGVLISSPLIFALPKATKINPNAGILALLGFLFMFLSNKYIKYKTNQEALAFGITAIEGIGIHSFVDGIIYTVTFSVSVLIGFLSGVGLVIHEFAEGVITYSVLLETKINRKKAALYAFFSAALTTPVGAFVAYPFVHKLTEPVLGLALGFVSGVLIYISASHLLPEARKYEAKHSGLAFISGVLLALFMATIKH
jgi:zinc and cadmium transporter